MVPRDVEIMIEAKQAEQSQEWQLQDTLNSIQCSILVNAYRDREVYPAPFTASDFMILKCPEPEPEEIPAEPLGMTKEQVRKSVTTMKNWVAATGGKHV